jgi:hypothetical protein
MSFSKLSPLTLALGCFAVVLAAAPRARAATCGTTDCGKGFTCVTISVPTPTPAPAVLCPKNTACPVVSPDPAVDAGATTVSSCEAASCTTDADCGTDMICHSSTEECASAGAACSVGTKCDPVPTPACTPKTISTCAYKWSFPCNVDADCGTGFTCMPQTATSCSGSGGGGVPTPAVGTNGSAASSGPNMPAPAVDGGATTPNCTTTALPSRCQPNRIICETSADCPATWTCAAQPVGVTGVGVATSGSTTSPTSGSSTSNTSSAIAPTPSGSDPAIAMLCTPPGGDDVTAAPPREIANGGGDASTTSTSGGGDSTALPKAGGTPDGSSSTSSGCAIAGGTDASALGLVALGLLAVARTRRRARA